MKVRIGDTLLTVKEEETISIFTNKKKIIPKGSKMIVRADNLVRHRDGMLQILEDDIKVEGYNIEGIASFITTMLCGLFSMEELEEYFEISKGDIEDRIKYALDELGF